MSENRLKRLAWTCIALLMQPLPVFAQNDIVPVEALKRHTHIHGLAIARDNPDNILIAKHHGIFRAGPNGQAIRFSAVKDFMGFVAHPVEPRKYFGSGHPPQGGNLGFIVSTDGGATWEQRSPGANGPVDFHQPAVSLVDPDIIFGAYGALQRSSDGGHEWRVVAALPPGLLSLAASAIDSETLYAGTRTGLLVKWDGGGTWEPVVEGSSVSLVAVTEDARILTFTLAQGLAVAQKSELKFSVLAAWGDDVLLHLAIDPKNRNRMFAATNKGDVFQSADGGVTWEPVRGSAG